MTIPIHYFFILLAILVSMTACTQKAPYGSNSLVNTSADTSKNVLNHNTDIVVKPVVIPTTNPDGNLDLQTAMEIKSIDGAKTEIAITGKDAEMLYLLLEVLPVKSKADHIVLMTKKGVDILCNNSRNKTDQALYVHVCVLNIQSSNGLLTENSSAKDLETFGPDMTLSDPYKSPFFELDSISAGKTGRLVILGDRAKSIYETMTVDVAHLADVGIAHQRLGKKGKNVACYQENMGTDVGPSYTCKFFFDYDTGKFDEITDLY